MVIWRPGYCELLNCGLLVLVLAACVSCLYNNNEKMMATLLLPTLGVLSATQTKILCEKLIVFRTVATVSR